MEIFENIKVMWGRVGLVQRALLLAIFMTFLIAGILLTYWARRPEMRLLYQDLAPDEAARITDKIAEQGIRYQLRDGGTTVYVPGKEVYQLRLDMAKEGLPSGGREGYKLFDEQKVGISPLVQSINLQRALQDELAASIAMIEGVAWARVHIVTPKRTLFKSDAEAASASVALRIKPGYRLSGSSIAAITHLVAGSVEALKAENVTIIDNQGRLLNGDAGAGTVASGATGVQDYRERIEQNLSAKVEEMLKEVLGPGRASVRVSAVVDMNSANIVTETYDPKGVPIREEIASESETKPGAVASDGSGSAPAANKKSETITTEMSVGKTVRQETIAPGKIKDLKVAAFVDLSPADANSTGPLMAVSDVEQIIRNALGLDNSSDLKVVDVPFNRPAEPEIVEAGGGLDFIALAGQASLGIMAVCALLALKILGAGKKGSVKGAQQAPALTAGDAENAQAKTHALEAAHREEIAGLLASGEQQIDEDKPQEIRKQIAGVFRKHPDEVKQLFAHWLTQGE